MVPPSMGEAALRVNSPKMPVWYRGGLGRQAARRRSSAAAISSSGSSLPWMPQMRSTRPGMSIWIRSPLLHQGDGAALGGLGGDVADGRALAGPRRSARR